MFNRYEMYEKSTDAETLIEKRRNIIPKSYTVSKASCEGMV
jgi:hypothetical protein